jgi:hypothetical protein
MNGCFRLAALDLRTLNLHSFYGSPGFHWQKPSFSSLLFFVGACLTRIIYCEGCSVSLRPLFSVYCFRDQACSALSRMSSLPNSFTYGSVSSVHSVRDAFASYYRSQYYPSSNVQTSDMGNDLSDDEPPLSEALDPFDSVDTSCAERHPRYMGVSEENSVSLEVSEAALQTAGMRGRPSPRQPIRAHGGRETTPLLRKAASFTVFPSKPTPASVGRTNYKPLTHPDVPNIVPRDATSVPSATIVEHHYNGKSTYGQTLFNCIAVLLGIGMLSEPLAFAYAGWLWGTVLIIFFGLITCYT